MARFEYAARDEAGKAISGEIVAENRVEAAKLLRAEGKFVAKLAELSDTQQTKTTAAVKSGSRRVKADQVIYFANQLAVMVDTGVPLADALAATIDGEPVSGFRTVVEDVINRVQSGQEFSASLQRHPKVFPSYFVNIIRASEASGLLGPMLKRVASYMTSQNDTKKKIKGAMAYPIAMLSFCILVAVFLLTFLLPKFTSIFISRGAALPLPTQILMTTSNFMLGNWYIIVPGVLLTLGGLSYFLRTPTGGVVGSWLKLNVPVIGPMFRKAYVARSMRTMGTMIDSGVSILETVAITRNVVDNHYYRELFKDVDAKLQKGAMLSEALRGTDLFPRTVIQMVLAGERAGQIGSVMNRIADFCEADLNNAIKASTQLIEPVLVIVMGTFIGGVVVALLLPIFTLSKVVTGG